MAEFIFNNECTDWSSDKKRNEMYLRYQEDWFNIQLENRGYVFLRDIYEILGIQITKESCTNEESKIKWEKERESSKKRNDLINKTVLPLRILIFPIMLVVRLFRWTYHYDD